MAQGLGPMPHIPLTGALVHILRPLGRGSWPEMAHNLVFFFRPRRPEIFRVGFFSSGISSGKFPCWFFFACGRAFRSSRFAADTDENGSRLQKHTIILFFLTNTSIPFESGATFSSHVGPGKFPCWFFFRPRIRPEIFRVGFFLREIAEIGLRALHIFGPRPPRPHSPRPTLAPAMSLGRPGQPTTPTLPPAPHHPSAKGPP